MKNLFDLLQNQMVKNLGWTLLHSVWQFFGLVSIYFLVLYFTKKASIRYWVGLAILAAQTFLSIYTFLTISNSNHLQTAIGRSETNQMLNYGQQFINFLHQNMPIIVGFWIIGCAVLLLRLVLSYVWINSLKNDVSNQTDANMSMILTRLMVKMNINKNIEIKTTTLVSLPMLMGVLKPVILMPVSIASGFSVSQIEVILAHELAHLKRHDFFINGVQSVLEVVFFFHPAMWWLSAQIRKERENCCDDIAVAVTQNKLLLAKTLVQLQETSSMPTLAMAFGKKPYSLLERIQRIVGINQPRSFTREGMYIAGAMLVTFIAFAQQHSVNKPKNKQVEISVNKNSIAKSDTLIKSEFSQQIRIQTDDNELEIKNEKIFFNNKLIELSSENQELMHNYLMAINDKNKELEKQNLAISEESLKINDISQRISQLSLPLSDISKKMGQVSEKMGKISSKYGNEISKRGLSEKEYEKIEKLFEEQMERYENEMSLLEDEMEKQNELMQSENPEMELIEAKMAKMEEPMDAISKEIDEDFEKIMKLMPLDIQSKMTSNVPKPPKPPRPPKVPNGVFIPKPPKAPKPPKVGFNVPPPPPFPSPSPLPKFKN
jgi:bla regulator protein blaR1